MNNICCKEKCQQLRVSCTYGDDVLDHGVGGGQAGPQQVRHHIYDLLVQLREPDN
jgi:hypothetical protein